MDKTEIRSLLIKYLIRYFKGGSLESDKRALIDQMLSSFDIKDFNDFDDIIDLHFVLSEGTRKFLEEFPWLIRMYNKTSIKGREVCKGKIKGTIDWKSTIVYRNNGDVSTRDSFVVSKIVSFEDIEENKVLAELLGILSEIICQTRIMERLAVNEWFVETKQSILKMNEVIGGIDYLKEKQMKVNKRSDERVLYRMQNSKRELYRRAADLLLHYYDCKEGKIEAIADLLAESFVEVCSEDTCYEMYWIFKTIEDSVDITKVHFQNIMPGNTEIAHWTVGRRSFKVYHNCGHTDNFEFFVRKNDLLNSSSAKFDVATRRYLERMVAYSKFFLGKEKSCNIFSGRPDIVIEITNMKTKKIEAVHIGEVKNTKSVDYAEQGLSELVSYIQYIRLTGDALGSVEKEGIKIYGFLCSDVEANNQMTENVIWRTFGKDDKYKLNY